MSKINDTSDCEFCKYGSVDESNKARVKVYCSLYEKTMWYGMYYECDAFTKQEKQEN